MGTSCFPKIIRILINYKDEHKNDSKNNKVLFSKAQDNSEVD